MRPIGCALLLLYVSITHAFIAPARPALVHHSARRLVTQERWQPLPPLRLTRQPKMADDASRKETIQSLSITGGLLLGCFGLYNLCTSAGVDEVLAGQVVLLTLVAFGTALVFFDGGITQAALEANAVQQMAAEEGMTMSKAPRVALQAEPQAERWGDTLKTDGLLRVDGLLPAEDARSLVSYVETRLSEGLEAVKEDEMKGYQYFGNVLVRNNRCASRLFLASLTSRPPAPCTHRTIPSPCALPPQVRRQAEARSARRGGAAADGLSAAAGAQRSAGRRRGAL